MFSSMFTYRVPSGESLICVAHSIVQVYNIGKLLKPSACNESKSLKLILILISQNFIISALGVLCNNQFFLILKKNTCLVDVSGT